jgi:hypothetical protein
MKETNWLHFGMTLPALINRVRAPPPTLCTMGEYETQHPTHGRRQAELAAPTPRAPDGNRTFPKTTSSTRLVGEGCILIRAGALQDKLFRLNPFAVKRGA